MSYYKYLTIGIYMIVSIPIFHLVYHASNLVIDEEFHLRQGSHYCNGSFDVVRFTSSGNLTTMANLHVYFYFSVGSENNHSARFVYCIHRLPVSSANMYDLCSTVNLIVCIHYQCLADPRDSQDRFSEGTFIQYIELERLQRFYQQ